LTPVLGGPKELVVKKRMAKAGILLCGMACAVFLWSCGNKDADGGDYGTEVEADTGSGDVSGEYVTEIEVGAGKEIMGVVYKDGKMSHKYTISGGEWTQYVEGENNSWVLWNSGNLTVEGSTITMFVPDEYDPDIVSEELWTLSKDRNSISNGVMTFVKPAAEAGQDTIPYESNEGMYIVMTKGRLNVRDKPGTSGGVVFQLNANEWKFSVLELTAWKETLDGVTERWVKIKTSDGRTGWVFGGFLGVERGGPRFLIKEDVEEYNKLHAGEEGAW
jgi:hypothetical protein